MTTPENRSKALAHVGIAFAICFCIGPPIGAYFATKPLPPSLAENTWLGDVNVYAAPALLTLVLLVVETVFLMVALPETRGKAITKPSPKSEARKAGPPKPKASIEQRIDILKSLRRIHFLFLGIFSGMEFTLTFMTFDCTSVFLSGRLR